MSHRYLRSATLCCLLLLSLVAGCSQGGGGPAAEQITPPAAPTVSSIFGAQPTIPPPATREPTAAIALPTTDPTTIAQATNVALGEEQLKEVPIYDDVLSPDWSLQHSFQTTIDLVNRIYVRQGHFSIRAQPQRTTGTLYFTLNKTARESFRRDQVQGVRFYLSGGSEPIGNEAMTVSVVGSNIYPYWVENDNSVKINGRVTDNQPVFSETRLYFLGINKAIPRGSYAEITVWLDNLLYDPSYTYVTGIYLKTDKQTVPTFYVDQVSLLLLPGKR